jgi:hypothetical protein
VTFVRTYRFNVATAALRARLLPTVFFGVLIAGTAGIAAAMTPDPVATSSVAKSLAVFREPDLMETAFREGLSLYEGGDYTEAARTWLAAAKHGHAGAQFSLGVAYATGNGVAQDLDAAIRWWNDAAHRGHATAQVNLGLLYWRGVGVERDLAKALSWWRRAADGGDAAAQFHLGAMAATGEGSPIDFDDAIHWWRLSAAQGYELAIEGLQIMERHGLTVDRRHRSAE